MKMRFSQSDRMMSITIALVLMVFVAVGVVGLGMTMEMNGDGMMVDCPVMGKMALCPMGVSEHVMQWKMMFLGIVPSLIVVAFAVFMILERTILKKENFQYEPFHLWNESDTSLFRYLAFAFSNGILHSKRDRVLVIFKEGIYS